jgi:hypothetical protein
MKYKQSDIHEVIGNFKKYSGARDRYSSFDYCYNYFFSTPGEGIVKDAERSCMALGFYLASWGMLRGSSFLLNKSAKYYEPLIKYIGNMDKSVWSIDIDTMEGENLKVVLSIYNDIKDLTIKDNNSHLTLTTKIMLGVFGFIPAFDQNFGNTFRLIFGEDCGFRSLNNNAVDCIRKFYLSNQEDIDRLAATTYTKSFQTGEATAIHYPKAKIIDMYGFQKSFKGD